MRSAVIVTADDFGRSREVNAAVVQALREGVLTSASLMITGAATDEAVAIARGHPELAVGLHVVVAGAASALPPARIRHLVDADSRLQEAPARQGLALVLSRAARHELALELEAQFSRFAATGLPLAHVDGHLHLHMHPVVFDLLVPLAVKYGARGIRIPADDHRLALRHCRRRSPSKLASTVTFWLLARRARRRLRAQPLAIAERVYGLLQSGDMNERYVLRLLSSLSAATAEIYFHPSTRALGDRLGPNTTDLNTLLSPAVKRSIAANHIRLASYQTLAAEGL